MDINHLVHPINIGQGKGYSIKESAILIKESIGFDGKIVFDTTKADGDPINVEAVIQSFSSELSSVLLNYKNYFSEDWTIIEMDNCQFAVDGFCGEISAQSDGSHIQYFIEAENLDGQLSSSPIGGQDNPYTFVSQPIQYISKPKLNNQVYS